MSPFNIRKAAIDDIPFLVDSIIEAEKGGTEILSYSTVFGLSLNESKKYIKDMLLEEVDGCELSISSYLVAEKDGQLVGAVGAWIEGNEGMPSSVLKGNLLNFTLPKICIEKALFLNNLVKDIHIENINNTIQVGIVYVSQSYRGLGLANILIEEQIKNLLQISPEIAQCYLQVFGDNKAAIKTYEKLHFKKITERRSENKLIVKYFPSASKVLMKRHLNINQ